MRPFFATIDAALYAIGRWLIQPLGTRIAVVSLLSIHAGLLAYSATRHSPTHLEPAFLASGISHWQFGRFELYRVNPPLPRMIAALPVLAVGCETDWSRFYNGPGSRAEFLIGQDFIKANGSRSTFLLLCGRWAMIPLSLLGGVAAFFWATELYGRGAGLAALCLLTFEPNLLAHAELVTPDCACWSFGVLAGYAFWRWLNRPNWTRAILAGLALGAAELTKLTWIILFAMWPVLWLVWLRLSRLPRHFSRSHDHRSGEDIPSVSDQPPVGGVKTPSLAQLIGILGLAVYAVNACYTFDGTFSRLDSFAFVSKTLAGSRYAGESGNRFAGTLVGAIPVPLPRQYVLGCDSQKADLEHYHQPSYLRAEWKSGGWWYYYCYGLIVKVPVGLLLLFVLMLLSRFTSKDRLVPVRDEIVLLAPAIVVLLICSASAEINEHLRYVFPSLPLAIIWISRGLAIATSSACLSESNRPRCRHHLAFRGTYFTCAAFAIASSLVCYPNHLAYFNECAGGRRMGWRHLLGSSFDWGQDNQQVCLSAIRAFKLPIVLSINSAFDPRYLGIEYSAHRPRSSDFIWVIAVDTIARKPAVSSGRFPPWQQPLAALADCHCTSISVESSQPLHRILRCNHTKVAFVSGQ